MPARLPQRAADRVRLLFNSRLTVEQFFELLAYDLDLRCNRLSKTEVLLSLNNMLLERASVARTTVLIVDEAHNLEWDVLEEIRLLGNLENRKGKLLQIVIAASRNWIASWKPRNSANSNNALPCGAPCGLRSWRDCSLRGFPHGARRAQEPDRDSPQLLEQLHYRAQGIPRVINAICDNLLLTAFALESRIATMEMLDEVTADMRLVYPGQHSFRPIPTSPADPAPHPSTITVRLASI